MISKKIGNSHFALLIGKITTDSCSATIKKLALAQQHRFVQIIPARVVAGVRHLEAALEHATSALKNKTSFSKNLELEFLVRLFGEKQLEKALQNAKFEEGEELVLVAAEKSKTKSKKEIAKIINNLKFKETKKFELGKNKKELIDFYKISQEEIETLSDVENAIEGLVIERVSFVALER